MRASEKKPLGDGHDICMGALLEDIFYPIPLNSADPCCVTTVFMSVAESTVLRDPAKRISSTSVSASLDTEADTWITVVMRAQSSGNGEPGAPRKWKTSYFFRRIRWARERLHVRSITQLMGCILGPSISLFVQPEALVRVTSMQLPAISAVMGTYVAARRNWRG